MSNKQIGFLYVSRKKLFYAIMIGGGSFFSKRGGLVDFIDIVD